MSKPLKEWPQERLEKLATLWADLSKNRAEIARELGTNEGAVARRAKWLGLPDRRRRSGDWLTTWRELAPAEMIETARFSLRAQAAAELPVTAGLTDEAGPSRIEGTIEISLPNNVSVLVRGLVDVRTLRRVLAALELRSSHFPKG